MITNMLRIVVLILPLLLGTGCRDRQKKSAPVVEAMRCTIEVVNEYPHSRDSSSTMAVSTRARGSTDIPISARLTFRQGSAAADSTLTASISVKVR